MSVRNYLSSIRKHWMWVLVPLVLVTVVTGVQSMRSDKVYTATAALFVSMNTGRTATDLAQGSQFTQSQMASFQELATMPTQLEPVVERLGLTGMTPKRLAKHIHVSAPTGKVLLYVSADAGDPDTAARLANAVAEQLAQTIEKLSPEATEGGPTVVVQVVNRAERPSYPSAPNTRRNVAGAAFAGLLLGLLAAVLRDMLDTRLRTQEDLETTVDVPLFGSVVGGAATRGGKRKGQSRVLHIDGPQSEDIRRIRANLQMAGRVDECQVFVFSSSIPGEGKSFCATHIASAFAAAGSQVLLIDADLRRPTVAKYLGVAGHAGLTEVLLGRARFAELCQQYAPNLTVLASGAVPPNPGELLSSRSFEDLIAMASQHFEVVVIDSPPLLPVVDAVAISRVATGVVLVVDVTKTRRAQVVQAVEGVRLGGGKVIGAVLNRTKTGATGASAYGYSSRPASVEDVDRRQARLDALRTSRGVTETSENPVVFNPQRPRR
ncbi:MAG: polysaccharide biosynthesis tyrosine autokinase [Micrococcales bacterium]|nr:polysaccharide biosynthesis tyrosine autokinase [Micrococcales bacterium]MCL2667269.1 polysaccharide biosynthesis tyrosine autokinase [Micrococcales bacterium]